jgi:UPF0176 protein
VFLVHQRSAKFVRQPDDAPVASTANPEACCKGGLWGLCGAMAYAVAAFYKFAPMPDYRAAQPVLLSRLKALGARGSVLLAEEGLNGTIATPNGKIEAAVDAIGQVTGVGPLEAKFSSATAMPFKRMKVRLKKEIVTIGSVYANPHELVGQYVEPRDWNNLIADPEVIVIDSRNSYECKIGTFPRAIDPGTQSFSAFPEFAREALAGHKYTKIAMFCTGGIRCEKATSFLKHEGFENVFHLKGGILKYLEEVPPQDSLWQGACFVFDERVAVGHGLTISDHSLCYGCLMPVSAAERRSPLYEDGVSCPSCAGNLTDAQLASNRERQRQFLLAQKIGARHLGPREAQ